MKSVIKLSNIHKSVKDGENNLKILDNCYLDVKKGDLIAILGKSGSGKTTLLNIISMIDRKFEGQYIFEGENLSGKSDKECFELRNKYIGYIYQDFNLIEDFNILQNVELPLGFQGVDFKKRRQVALEFIEKVGLSGRESTIVSKLSGGELQRVCIARALCKNPKIILADEPTGSLDVNTGRDIMKLIVYLNNHLNITTIIVSHDLEVASKCKRILRLEDGVLNYEN